MLLTEDQTVHLDCNWKAVFDNFGELYHARTYSSSTSINI